MPDDETMLTTAKGPMTVAQALADPDAFVGGMIENVTYGLFVPFAPTIAGAMLRDWNVKIEPFRLGSKAGSLVTTKDMDVYLRLMTRFHHREDSNHAPA